jgi:hypothetical protein
MMEQVEGVKPTIHQINRTFGDQIHRAHDPRIVPGALDQFQNLDRANPSGGVDHVGPRHAAAHRGVVGFLAAMALGRGHPSSRSIIRRTKASEDGRRRVN